MAVGNAIVQTAKFKPLSYSEWAAPLKEISTQHTATEEALWELQDKMADYEQYIINNPNSELSKQYKSYISDLEEEAARLSSQGINSEIRSDLLDLRRQYTSLIKPIKTGIGLYQAAVTKRAKDQSKGIIGQDITPELYINNPAYIDNYTTMEDIYRNASKVFKGLSGYSTEPHNKILDDGSSVMVTPQSYSAEDFANAFEGKEAPEEITNAVNLLRRQYDVYGADDNSKYMIEQSIKAAAQSAIKDPKYSGRHYPRAPRIEKPKPTEEETIRNKQGKVLTNTSWTTTTPNPSKNGKGKTTYSLSTVPKGTKGKPISLEYAQENFNTQLNLLRQHHSEFNNNPQLFDIVYYTYTKGGKSIYKLAVRLKEQYHYKENPSEDNMTMPGVKNS